MCVVVGMALANPLQLVSKVILSKIYMHISFCCGLIPTEYQWRLNLVDSEENAVALAMLLHILKMVRRTPFW